MISLLVPWWGGSPIPLKRTIDSCAGIVDDVVIVHQQLFDEDAEVARSLGKVATTNWNECFMHGFGHMTMQGIPLCSGPWVLWLGTGETIAEQLLPIRQTLSSSKRRDVVYRVSHFNDPHFWQRFFCPSAGNIVSGRIHEDVNGDQSYVIARMQDTQKESTGDPFKDEVLKWFKTVCYNWNYYQLGLHPEQRGNSHEGWLGFVRGAWESITAFCETNKDLIEAAKSGDRESFYEGVRRRMALENPPSQNVNFNPTGDEFSEGALPLIV